MKVGDVVAIPGANKLCVASRVDADGRFSTPCRGGRSFPWFMAVDVPDDAEVDCDACVDFEAVAAFEAELCQ